MNEVVIKLLDRAVVEINQNGDAWVSWKNSRRSFGFTVFKDGGIASGNMASKCMILESK